MRFAPVGCFRKGALKWTTTALDHPARMATQLLFYIQHDAALMEVPTNLN
jgi:hypothetical protein